MRLPLKWIILIVLGIQQALAMDIELPGLTSRLYTDASGGYIQSKNFDGGGGSVRMGYNVQGGHNVEFEANFFFESGSAGTSNTGFLVGPIAAIPALSATYSQTRKVNLNLFPLMFNYRYIGHFGGKAELAKVMWYAGVGLGVVIFDWQNKYSWSSSTTSSLIPGQSGSTTYSHTTAAFGAQGFLGVGYSFTHQLSGTFGARILGTQDYSFGGGQFESSVNTFSTPSLSTELIHWMVEGGLHYLW